MQEAGLYSVVCANSTEVRCSGPLNNTRIKIKQGRHMVLDTMISHKDGDFVYILRETGCYQIAVNLTRNKTVLYNDTTPFHCGE